MKKISFLLAIFIAGSTFLNLKADSPRKVLYEKFTNASCPPCAAQDPAYKGFLANPANKSIIIPISYHVNFPGSDIINSINNDIPSTRRAYHSVTGVPAGRANGITHPASPQWYAGAPGDTNSIANTTNTFRGQMSPLTITINQQNNGNQVVATVNVTSSQSMTNKRLQIAFIERYFFHPNAGTNGQTEFEYVVRDMTVNGVRSSAGRPFTINLNETITHTETWQIPTQANPKQIYVVAFVEDISTKEVVQAESNLVEAPKMLVNADSKYSIVDRNSTLTKKVSITNPANVPLTVSLKVDDANGILHPGSSVEFSTETLNLGANETKEVDVNFTNSDKGGYSSVAYNVSTEGAGISVPETKVFGFLSKGTKYVVYTGFSGFVKDAYTGVSSNPDYMNEIAFLPIIDGNEYFPTEKVFLPESFDVSIFALGSYPLAFNNNPHNVAALAQTLLNAGKHVYIGSTDGMYYTFNPTGAGQVGNPPSSLNFYQTMLGLQYKDNVARNDGQRYTGFTVTGVMNDPVGKGLSIPANSFPQNDPNLRTIQGAAFTDVFSLTANSRAIPCFYYNNVSNDVAGVRYRNASNSARLVYTSFTIESLGSKMLRDATMKDIMDWLVNDSPTSVVTTVESGVSVMPNPASIFSTINFQSTTNQAVTISVIDVQGKVVLMNEISTPTVGTNSYSLMTSKLSNGSYTVVVKQGENVSRTPLVIMN